MQRYNIRQILPVINPKLLEYQEWINVGFVMRDEGMTAEEWEAWSSSDPRHKPGECIKKWKSFGRNANGVTVGTLVEYARRQGWSPVADGHELDWDDTISSDRVVDKDWLEEKEIREPDDAGWDQKGEIIRYLEALFESTDIVGYVTEVWERDGKPSPTKGAYDRTAGELIAKLQKCTDITDVIGSMNHQAGAWVRFNPLDGKDVANANVTDFRYALVESDSMPIEKQYAMMTELNLPIRILVASGGKSLHAITRIDAGSIEEYRKRVDYLYSVCRKNGFDVDIQNKNPSRLSRLPGVYRNGKKQFIVAENIGCGTFHEWKDWVEAASDDLPDFDAIEDIESILEPLDPPLIDGILRQGQKMLLAGPSKAGKSFAMIELAIAIAKGVPWMGYPCTKGRVLYVNLQLERKSCLHRINDVRRAMGLDNRLGNLVVWNLRGQSTPMDKLAPKLIRRAMKQNFIAVIIDPIYKVLTGDENNAEQMAHFCAQFDCICTELGTSVIYCHHHSKGIQGNKKAMDRSSGSGVFARDPDALLDMIELELTDAVRKYVVDTAAMGAIKQVLGRYCPGWERKIPIDDQLSRQRLENGANKLLDTGSGEHCQELIDAVAKAEKEASANSAWRLEGTLREFPKPPDINCWFRYPVHVIDDSQILSDMSAEAALPPWQKGAKRSQNKRAAKKDGNVENFKIALDNAHAGEPPTLKEVSEYMNKPVSSIRRWMQEAGYMVDKNNGNVIIKAPSDNAPFTENE